MDITGLGSITGLLGKVADKLWPDPVERARQQIRLLELEQAGVFKSIDSKLEEARLQTDTNKEEAKHGSLFVSGARPFVMWVCGTSLAYTFIIQPFLVFLCVVAGLDIRPDQIPTLDSGELTTVLMGMLGLGGLRTFERYKGVAAVSVSK